MAAAAILYRIWQLFITYFIIYNILNVINTSEPF